METSVRVNASTAFRVVAARYAFKIQTLRVQMTRISVDVLHCNRARVDKYLASGSLCVVDYLLRSLLSSWDPSDDDPSLMIHFEDYVEAEEQRLQKNLQEFRWDIDASNILLLIIGSGRIERVRSASRTARRITH